MSLSLRSLSSHQNYSHLKASAQRPTAEDGIVDDALHSNSNPFAGEQPSQAIDSSSAGQPSSGFAAFLNQLLTEAPSEGATASPQPDGLSPLKDGTDSAPPGDESSLGVTSLDALLRALAEAPVRNA